MSIDTKERKNDMCLYSVVVPVYNSEHTLQELYTRLEKVFRETIKEEFELIFMIMKEGKSEAEKAQMDDMLNRAQRLFSAQSQKGR